MALTEKLEKLTPKQREKFAAITTEQELNAALAEASIPLTAEEKETVLKQIQVQARELTDEEAEQAVGGAWFQKCPRGKYEYFFFSSKEECQGCAHFRLYENGVKISGTYKDVVMCQYFNKTVYLEK